MPMEQPPSALTHESDQNTTYNLKLVNQLSYSGIGMMIIVSNCAYNYMLDLQGKHAT